MSILEKPKHLATLVPHRLIEQLSNFHPAAIGNWAYVLIFIVTIFESFPLLGAAVPGGLLVMSAGFFIRLDVLNWLPTIAVCIAGAIIGDAWAYYLGRRYGHNLLTRFGKYIMFHEKHYYKTKELLSAHPAKALIAGRYYTITRALVPFVAGSVPVPMPKFFLYATISAIFWTISNLGLGYIFGHGFALASRYASIIFVIIVVLAIVGALVYRQGRIITTKYWHIVERYQIYPLIATFMSFGLFSYIARMTITGRQIAFFDYTIARWFGFLRSAPLTDFFIFITELMTPLNLIIVATVITVYFAWRHRWYYELLLPVALLGGTVSDYFFKVATQHARPLKPLIEVSSYSFPSGHATLSTIFFLLMIYFFARRIQRTWLQSIFVATNVSLIVLVCISRLYLNVHWFSDVISGVILGIFWIGFSMIVLRFLETRFKKV